MPRSLQIVGAILLVMVGAAFAVLILKASGLSVAPDKDLTFAEFTSIILSALGVMLAALAIFLGAMAFVGWSSFETLVQRRANDYLQERFGRKAEREDELKELRELIREELALQSPQSSEQPENESPFDESAV